MNGIIIYVGLNQMDKYLKGEEFFGWTRAWNDFDSHTTTQLIIQPEDIVKKERIAQDGYYRLKYTVNIKKRLEF